MGMGAVLRLWGLTAHPFNFDECFTAAIGTLPFLKMLWMTAVVDASPPAAYIPVYIWEHLFGGAEISLRFFSWSVGMLGILLTYLLALRISGSRRVACLSALLIILPPILVRHSIQICKHNANLPLVVLSWWLFLKVCSPITAKNFFKSRWVWAYMLATTYFLYVEPISFIAPATQGLYWLLMRQTFAPLQAKRIFMLLAALGVCFMPVVWLYLQPWHASHFPEFQNIYGPVGGLDMLLYTPVNLFLAGQFEQSLPLDQPMVWVYGLAGGLLFFLSFRSLFLNMPKSVVYATLCIGIVPMVLLYLLALLMQLNFFQHRAMLFCTFSLAFVVACYADTLLTHKRRYLAVSMVLLTVAFQFYGRMVDPMSRFDIGYKYLAETVKMYAESGDGFVVYPGRRHLAWMRYFNPAESGFTQHDLNFDYKTENFWFKLVHRLDEHHFFVSGQTLLNRPDIKEAFQQFQKNHQRIWVISESPEHLEPLMSCGPVFLFPDMRGVAWEVRCPSTHPDHCVRPLGKAAWRCPNRQVNTGL